MSVISLFDYGAQRHPERLCLEDDGGQHTYQQVRVMTHRIALALRAHGVQRNDKIATLSPNGCAMVLAMLGIYRAGCVFAPLNVLNSEDDNRAIVTKNDVSVLFYHSKFTDVVKRLRSHCPQLRVLVQLDDAVAEDHPSLAGFIEGHDSEAPDPGTAFGDLVSIYSTGGTTGVPKGAMISALAWDVQASSFFREIPLGKPPVYLAATPFSHAAGCLAIYLFTAGGHVILHDKFDAAKFLRTLSERHVTHAHLPPTAIYMLLSQPDIRQYDFTALECFHYASAPMSVEKLRDCMDIFGPVMTQSWGQSEAPLICTILTPEDHRLGREDPARTKLLSSCGRPTLMTRVEAIDDEGRFLPPGEWGELVMNGPLVGMGYYGDPEATSATFVDGWLRSGDIGFRDEEGYIYICDRKKDMIISGGLNIYPGEIDQVLWSHPAVQDGAVFGVPDEKWGEMVKAIVELKPGAHATSDELIAFCRERLGSVKAPKSIEVWPALPRTAVGKVNKKEIRGRFWAGTDRKI